MKKFFTLAVIAAALMACGSKANKNAEMIAETASDSAFTVNDSTVGNLANLTYEGMIPAQGSKGTAYTIVFQRITADSIGSYTMTMTPVDPKTGKEDAVKDSGLVVTIIGNPNTNGAIVYQLISATPEKGKKNFIVASDSTIILANEEMKQDTNTPVVLKKTKE